ncbi:hypothetical protein DIM_09410 [Candidatus Denitrolinea symbiosum]|nr:hypothetical protein DIM_09410 [Candidatus Denitrolinea symbiosum]
MPPSSDTVEGFVSSGGSAGGTVDSGGRVGAATVEAGFTETTKMAAATDARLPTSKSILNIRFIFCLPDDISPDMKVLAPFC